MAKMQNDNLQHAIDLRESGANKLYGGAKSARLSENKPALRTSLYPTAKSEKSLKYESLSREFFERLKGDARSKNDWLKVSQLDKVRAQAALYAEEMNLTPVQTQTFLGGLASCIRSPQKQLAADGQVQIRTKLLDHDQHMLIEKFGGELPKLSEAAVSSTAKSLKDKAELSSTIRETGAATHRDVVTPVLEAVKSAVPTT